MDNEKRFPFLRLILISIGVLSLTSCNYVTKVILLAPQDSPSSTTKSNSDTTAAFWGLPGIKFSGWRPNIHIKASTDNGVLAGRVWEGNPGVNPDTWSLFEYSQVLYYDSDYLSLNIQPDQSATVDNDVIMPLAFEQKLYKRVAPSSTELPKSDVSWDSATHSVNIKLNTVNSNYLTLSPGARIAVFATQRPSQWGGTHDYTIVDSFPGTNCLQKSLDRSTLLLTPTDRSATRTLGYLEYSGGTMTVSAAVNTDWFSQITVTSDTITLKMPHLDTGDLAKAYWDGVDASPIAPFMLFWVAIQQ